MLSHLKVRLASLQEEITASVKSFSSTSTLTQDSTSILSSVNTEAGCEFLKYYQDIWEELHKKNEVNIRHALRCDTMILNLRKSLERQWKSMAELHGLVSKIPKMNQDILAIMDTLGNLESLFGDVEVALFALEDTIDNVSMKEKQLDQRFQLAIYQERRQAEYNDLTTRLQAEYQKKKEEADLKRRLLTQEKEKGYQKQFEQDMYNYKTRGTLQIPRIPDNDVSLETVDLDEEDDPLLEAFLEDDDFSSVSIVKDTSNNVIPESKSIYFTPDSTSEKLQEVLKIE